jgi:endonuclease I
MSSVYVSRLCRKLLVGIYLLLPLFLPLCLAIQAQADTWDPPVNYYSAAIGTGATLKSQLTTIMSTGHILRSYGNFKEIAPIVDQDPNNLNNVLLVYNRASVQGLWSSGGVNWNREHTWPDSRQPGNASEGSTGAIADPHMLRPCNPSINSSRGNKAYGFETNTGQYGSVDSSYYFPGDADKGDMARTMFYAATRWSSEGLSLTDSNPSGNEMGDLSSLIAWNYLDTPDEFERRRNHTVYSQAYNPLYSNNRNAFVDRPEYVWSVYVNQTNDSRVTIGGATPDANGGSVRNVDLGRVFVGGAVPAAQSFTLNKAGNNGTYFEVTTVGTATSSITGRYNAFRTNQTDSKSILVGLNTNTTTAGLRSGTATIDNLDVTTLGGAGRGANDANDTFNVSLSVLDHASPSFASPSLTTSLSHNFGTIAMGSSAPTFNFDLFNLATTAGYTASMDFDSVAASGASSVLTTNLAASAGQLALAGGASQSFTAAFSTAAVGNFSATYTLSLSDENIAGALNKSLTLTLSGQIISAAFAGDYNDDGQVDAGDYVVWRKSLATGTGLANETASMGVVDDADYAAWRANFGAVEPSGIGAGTAIPEPTSVTIMLMGLCSFLCMAQRRR